MLNLQGASVSIRKVKANDLETVSAVCIDAFMVSVAPTLEGEGIATFHNIASIKSLDRRMEEDNVMLVYEEAGDIVGFIELKEGRHIAMLFVSPRFQKKGIGESLVSEISIYARNDVVTVNASLTSVSAYLSFGFQLAGEISELKGLTYQPMEIKINKANVSDIMRSSC
jgi:GNAT superfamily N-acetyltransferase